MVVLTGRGGQGAGGGDGAAPSIGYTSFNSTVNNVTSGQNTTTWGAAGEGGDGGRGGNGTASVTGATITGSAANDNLTFILSAFGGLGGTGGNGALGVAGSSMVAPNGVVNTVVGTPDGLHGLNGAAGRATVTFSNNIINLGDGSDTLMLDFTAGGPGARSLTMRGNVIDGGLGIDTLRLGDGTAGEAGFIVDVQNNTIRIGSGPLNTQTGFEIFRGGSGNDRFLDGVGNQTYQGGLGADRFEFASGRAGADRIETFEANDVIRLTGFGPALDSFAEVQAVTTSTANGALIQTSATSSILLAGMSAASLQADDFLFS
jgi:hypothetical protein